MFSFSGKGVTSSLLALKFPSARILQIDNNPQINLAHLKSLPNLEFVLLDIIAEFDRLLLLTESKLESSKIGFIIGIHICGDLSRNAIRLFSSVPNAWGLILSPCCPNSNHSELFRTSKLRSIEPYDLWTMELATRLFESNHFVTFHREPLMDCLRNHYIVARKVNERKYDYSSTSGESLSPIVKLKLLIPKRFLSFLTNEDSLGLEK